MTDGAEPRDQLVAATRRLAAAVGRTGVGGEEMVLLAKQIDALVAPLQERVLERVPRTAHEDAVGATAYTWQVHNPAMPGVRMTFVDGVAQAEMPGLNHLYEGPPGLVHGGVSAMLMDTIVSSAVQFHGYRAMTASLTTDYRRPTPLGRPLTLLGRLESVDGRKVLTSGELICDGEVRIRARGLFLCI